MDAKEVASRRSKLRNLLRKWKVSQKDNMLKAIEGLVASGTDSSSLEFPEKEVLFLPSHFSAEDRVKYQLQELADQELFLRKGTLFDSIRAVQMTSKIYSVLKNDMEENSRGQVARTRSASKIKETERILLVQIEIYNTCRAATVALGGDEYASTFPPMSRKDTYRTPTHQRHQVGTSTKSAGGIFHTGVTGGASSQRVSVYHATDPASSSASIIATQGQKAKPRMSSSSYK